MFDGVPQQQREPDFRLMAQHYANLRMEDLGRTGGEIIALRMELEAIKGLLAAANARIAELDKDAPAA